MSFFNNVVNSVTEAVEDFAESVTQPFGTQPNVNNEGTGFDPDSGSAPNGLSGDYKTHVSSTNVGPKVWKTNAQDWYKTFGYRFSVAMYPLNVVANIDDFFSYSARSEARYPHFKHFTLPIPPTAIAEKMVVPSEATPTLGGVVEQTSQVKFWLMNLMGTTGTALQRVENDIQERKNMASAFRRAISSTGLLAGTTDAINAQIAQIGGTIDTATAALANPSVGGIASSITGAVAQTQLPQQTFSTSAVGDDTNGFVEAQELEKFLFMYNALKSRFPTNVALLYTDFKTDRTWRCKIADFSLQKNADNPNLYRYNISMKLWNLLPSATVFTSEPRGESDRFGPNGDLRAVNPFSVNEEIASTVIGADANDFAAAADNLVRSISI